MAKTRDTVQELPAQEVGFLFGTMFDLTTLPKELKHTGKVAKGEFKIVAHFPAIHAKNGTEASYLARHRTFRGGLYATYQDGPYKIDEVNWDATNRAGVHMVTMTKYGQVVEFPSQPSKTMPGSLKLMVQELVESLKTPGFIIRCSGLGGALEPKKGTTDEYNVILLNGDVKCPKKLANHVPAKYHAEDESIFLAQTGPWCGNAEDYQKPPWIKGPGRKTRAMRSAKKQKNIDLREKRQADEGRYQWTHGLFDSLSKEKKIEVLKEIIDHDSKNPRYSWSSGEIYDPSSQYDDKTVPSAAFNLDGKNVNPKVMLEHLKKSAEQMTQMGDSFFPVIPNTGGGDSALGSGRGVPQWYGAESAFDKLANKVAQGYIKKGKSKEEALEIGRKTAYKIGAKKYGKAGMKRKSMEGRMRRKNAEETMNFEFSNLPGLPVVPNDFGESSALMSGNSVPQWYGSAENHMSLSDLSDTPFGAFVKPDGTVIMVISDKSVKGKEQEAIDWGLNHFGKQYEGVKFVKYSSEYDAETFEAPMPFYPPSKGDVDRVQKAIRSRHQGIRFKGSPTYLTERKDGSNKYHVFQMTNRGGFNGYGRIGHTMSLFGPMSPQQYQSKLKSKMRKGYRETGF
jgi:hypothetical protein